MAGSKGDDDNDGSGSDSRLPNRSSSRLAALPLP